MNHKYKNPIAESAPKLTDMLGRALSFRVNGSGRPALSVVPKMQVIKRPVEKDEGVRITWLGHSGWLIQVENKAFLIDPVMNKNLGSLVIPRARFKARLSSLPAIEYALITHDHHDHLNIRVLNKIECKVAAGIGTGKMLRLREREPVELDWWESLDLDGVRITFVPSKHWARRGAFDTNKRLWGGFVIESASATVYHAGDSAYWNGFKDISERFPDIDIALLPIGAYGSEEDCIKSHITPEQAVKAYLDLQAKFMVPMHWGMFRLSDEPLDEPPSRLALEWERRKLDPLNLKIMAVGQSAHYRKGVLL